ncbi:MAG: hypothetical protein KDK64_08105, partial [Chlamydiia bacterium]|nr:hypothetical protein [Chlamydiia bacterium]
LFETFSALIDDLKDPINVPSLCSALNQISAAAAFPELTMIRYGNYLRDMILAPVATFSELTPQALKKLEVACLLVSEEMGFTKEQVEHAQAVMREIKDSSEGQLGRLQAAAATLHADFNYSGYGPTQARKMTNYLFGW